MKFKKLTVALCSTTGKTEQINGYTVNAAYNAEQMQTIT